jgi:hypothetical protein
MVQAVVMLLVTSQPLKAQNTQWWLVVVEAKAFRKSQAPMEAEAMCVEQIVALKEQVVAAYPVYSRALQV